MLARREAATTIEVPVRGMSYYRREGDPLRRDYRNFDVHAFQDVGVRVVLE